MTDNCDQYCQNHLHRLCESASNIKIIDQLMLCIKQRTSVATLKADITCRDNAGVTPIQIAAEEGHMDAVLMMLEICNGDLSEEIATKVLDSISEFCNESTDTTRKVIGILLATADIRKIRHLSDDIALTIQEIACDANKQKFLNL